ncbi:MAG: PilZ domain-containing protein [Deltaproteobacteria bacterium]|nr:PilZ domain-containing protein [Deltaproteobacteria bacterium]
MGSANRRGGFRIPLQMLINEYRADHAQRCLTMNVSATGLYLNRLVRPASRDGRQVALEFELPGTGETIWAAGDVRFDHHDRHFYGTGVHFRAMARGHHRMIQDYLAEFRARELQRLLSAVRRNRRS